MKLLLHKQGLAMLMFLVASKDILMWTPQERIITSPIISWPSKMTQSKGQVGPVKVEMTQSNRQVGLVKKIDFSKINTSEVASFVTHQYSQARRKARRSKKA